jgi:tetratricopeptide (TPR) repeat protein
MEGAVLGSCRVEQELGSGGMGKVYRARVVGAAPGLEVGQPVAIKVVHPHLLETPGFFKRFLREAQIGQQVRHANVVRTFDCDAVRQGGTDHHFLVMELVDGQTLRDLHAELGQVPEELCRHIGREIARGLAAIHAAGVIHRDLKPENVMITHDQVVKVMDLGVARLQEEIVRLSRSGHFVGSLEYAAPEQFREGGTTTDARTDLYALGVVLYELSTGQHPHRDEDPRRVLRRILDDEPRRAGEVNPQLSAFFEEVVHGLLAKDPEQRFGTADELALVLEQGERSRWWSSRAKAMRLETRRPLRRIRIPRETALYGREDDLERLRSLHARACAGDGQVLLLEGEAGIGKTRLVDEFVSGLRAAGEDLNFLFGSYPPGGAATAAGAFSTAYREHFGHHGLEGTLRGYLGGSSLLIPGFAAILRGDVLPQDAEALTKDSLQTVFVRVTRGLAEERPTIVLIEDLHFAPDEGLALFASLALVAPGCRLLLIGTTRRGLPESWTAPVERLDQVTKHVLSRLGPKHLVNLLEDAFRSERLARELAANIAVKSDGNPLFAFEIIRGLREGRLITQADDGSWSSAEAIERIAVPSTILDLIQARIADASAEERDLLAVASCCGFEFDATLVGDAVGLERIPTLRLFARIENVHALVRCVGERFVFDHHQVQEALYGGLPPPLAREYHAALARAIERREGIDARDLAGIDGSVAVQLCEHWFAGAGEEHALRYLDAALDHLVSGYQNAHAVALADRALNDPQLVTGERRIDLLTLACQRLELLGRRDEERRALEEAVALAHSLELAHKHALLLGHLGWHLARVAAYDEALDVLQQVDDLGRRAADGKIEGMAKGNLGLVFHRLGRYEEARVHHERHLEIARELGDPAGEAKALGNLGLVFHRLGRLDEARAYHERSLAIARAHGSRWVEGLALGNLGAVYADLGRYDAAQEHCERHLALVREIGDRRGEVVANGNLGFLLYLQGRHREALAHFVRQHELSLETGDRRGESLATGNLGIVFRATGRHEEARAQHERHLQLATELGDRRGVILATGNLANVFASLGRYAEARATHERHLALSREIGYRRGEALARFNLGVEATRCGEAHLAREHLEAAVSLAQEVGFRSLEPEGPLALAELAVVEGDDARADERFRKAVEHARALGTTREIARALTAHGGFLARAGRSAEALPVLEEAQRLAAASDTASAIALAACHRALCEPDHAAAAAEAFAAEAPRLDAGDRLLAHYLLWRGTGEPAHLVEARRLLDAAAASTPEALRESMLTQVPLHRDIVRKSDAAGSPS